MKKVGVLLAGSGVYDGSEIREAVLSILALEKAKVNSVYLAPNITQTHVINHQTGTETVASRNVLVESARIARGPVEALETYDASLLDALIIPGGFGVAKNLCDFAFTESDFTIQPDTQKLLEHMQESKKPIGLACIAPVLAAKLFPKVKLTIGNDPSTIKRLEALGATHHVCEASDIVTCESYAVVTTPAYMLNAPLDHIAEGIEKWVNKVLSLIEH